MEVGRLKGQEVFLKGGTKNLGVPASNAGKSIENADLSPSGLIAMDTVTVSPKDIGGLSINTVNALLKHAKYALKGYDRGYLFGDRIHPEASGIFNGVPLKEISQRGEDGEPKRYEREEEAEAVRKKIMQVAKAVGREWFEITRVDGNKVYLRGKKIHSVDPDNNTYTVREAIITTKLDNVGGVSPEYLVDDIIIY